MQFLSPPDNSVKSSRTFVAKLLKNTSTIVLTLLQLTLAVSLPLWLYGIGLAFLRGSINSILAMTVMNVLCAVMFWRRIVKPIEIWIKLKKPAHAANDYE